MASQRDIRRRIASVQNTRKITKAMEMVAAARLRRAQQRIEATRPYALNMLGVHRATGAATSRWTSADYPAAQGAQGSQEGRRHRPHRRPGAGGRFQLQHHAAGPRAGATPTKPRASTATWSSWAARASAPPASRDTRWTRPISDVTERRAFSEAQAIAHGVIRRYSERADRPGAPGLQPVQERHGAVRHRPGDPAHPGGAHQHCTLPADAGEHMDFLFEPSPEAILADLLPTYIEISVYRAILESMASEHGARMTAMRAASDAADRDDRRADPGDEPGAAVLHHPGDPGSGGGRRRPVRIGHRVAHKEGGIRKR